MPSRSRYGQARAKSKPVIRRTTTSWESVFALETVSPHHDQGANFLLRQGIELAANKLWQIHTMLQQQIMFALQIALARENAVLNVTILHEASVFHRRDAIEALNDLRQRIIESIPIPAFMMVPPERRRGTSVSSASSYITAPPNQALTQYLPPGVTVPEEIEKEQARGLKRIFSSKKSQSSGGEQLSAKQALLAPLPPPPIPPKSHQRHASYSPTTEWPSPLFHNEPGSPMDLAARLQGLDLTWSPNDRSHSIAASSEYSAPSDSNGSASPPFRSDSFAMPAPLSPDPQYQGFHPGYPPVQRQEDTLANLRKSQTIVGSTISMPTRPQVHGRPSKSNNYYGFCKGAWETRDEVKSGMEVRSRPDGYSMYSTMTVWACKFCCFEGNAIGKKPYKFDEKIHTSQSGIRYRWIFLVKSHVKKKNYGPDKRETNFGCMFCCDNGQGTSIYGNVETLMNHIKMEHSKPMAPEVQQKMRCVQGRIAIDHEGFDINIPTVTSD